jgi:apolipoprotein N-acyltransferase
MANERSLGPSNVFFDITLGVGAPFLWVSLEVYRTWLPEISFPWNLLGYPAAANVALVQLTALTGIYGLSFVVAAFNSLLAWCAADMTYSPRRRLTILLATIVLLFVVMLAGPHFVPRAVASHTARAVQLNFPEVQEYPADWFTLHASIWTRCALSLAPASQPSDLLVGRKRRRLLPIRMCNLCI